MITHTDNPNEKIWFKTPAAAARSKGSRSMPPTPSRRPNGRADRRDASRSHPLGVLSEHDQHQAPRAGAAPGAFNMHGSLLPKYRGRLPINWAVLNGETRIGMTLHRMVKEPDAGNSSIRKASTSGPGTRPNRLSEGAALRAPRARPPDRCAAFRHRAGNAAGPVPGHVFRGRSGGRPHRLGNPRAGSSTWCAPSPIRIPARFPTSGRPA